MINQLYVVICDGCETIAKAKCGGNQRDTLWTAPDGWTRGVSRSDVHFCPECTRKLSYKSNDVVNKHNWRSNAEEL